MLLKLWNLSKGNAEKEKKRRNARVFYRIALHLCLYVMSRESISVSSTRSKDSEPSKYNRSLKPLARVPPVPDEILAQLLKFRIDGQSINARNVGEVYPGLDNLLVRCLRTGDDRQLKSRLNRNLKPEYLLITGKHIHISVCARTQDILENLISMGATLGKRFVISSVL